MHRMIGSGGGGCVYVPPLCGDQDENIVGKIGDSSAVPLKREIKAAKLLSSVPDIDKYVILIDPIPCDATITPEIAKECRFAEDVVKEGSKTIKSYQSKYGGVQFGDIPHKAPTTFQWLYESLMHLLEGLTILHSKGLYHLDIYSSNIVVSSDGTCRLIDFGLSVRSKDDIEAMGIRFYDRFPLFLNAYTQRDKTPPISDYYDAYETYMEFYHPKYGRGTIYDWIALEIFRGTKKKYLEDVVMPNLSKADGYELAETFNGPYVRMMSVGKDALSPRDKQYAERVGEAINKMLDPRVKSQMSVEDVLKYLKAKGPI